MPKGIIIKTYAKSVLVKKISHTNIVDPVTGEVLGVEPVHGEAGMLNINVENLTAGQVLTNLRWSDEKVPTKEGIEKQRARIPLEASDYLPFARVYGE